MADGLDSITKTYDLIIWLMPVISKFPRDKRYTLGQRLEDKILDILDLLIQAKYSRDKIELLKKANLWLENFRYLIRLSYDLRFITLRRYEYISQHVNEIGRLVGGWTRQQSVR